MESLVLMFPLHAIPVSFDCEQNWQVIFISSLEGFHVEYLILTAIVLCDQRQPF